MKEERRSKHSNAVSRPTLLVVVITLIGLASASEAGGGQTNPPPSPLADQQRPAETPAPRTLTAREAYEKWKTDSGKPIILDVRTPEEFMFVGHPKMAWNVPVAAQSYVWNAAAGQFPMRQLSDFVARVEQIAGRDDTLLVMCRSGARSAQAVDLLVRASFRNVYNITDGMEGDVVKDPYSVFYGQRMVNGWKNSGLPSTYEVDPKRMILSPSR